jgi:WD40 repeat protein
VRIWDTKVAREALFLPRRPFSAAHHVFFGPDDKEIVYSRLGEGTFRREFKWQEGGAGEPAVAEVGPETRTPVPKSTFLSSVGLDRKTWLSRDGPKGAFVLPEGQMEGSRVVSRAAARLIMSLSPDGHWSAAVCDEDRRYLDVWDARNLTAVTNMGNLYVLTAAFSPDSRWLVGASDKGHHIWETSTWKEAFFYPCSGRVIACVCFAANGRRVALLQPDDTILLVSLPDGRELVRLKPPFPLMLLGTALSPDGNRLWVLGVGQRIYEWDLSALRPELAKLGLDWQD